MLYFQNKAVYRAEDRPADICSKMTFTRWRWKLKIFNFSFFWRHVKTKNTLNGVSQVVLLFCSVRTVALLLRSSVPCFFVPLFRCSFLRSSFPLLLFSFVPTVLVFFLSIHLMASVGSSYSGLLVGRGKKMSNFAGFSGSNSRKKRPISREFRGSFRGQFRWKNDW